MVAVPDLLAWMQRRPPLPPVEPSAPLCRSCGERQATVGEVDPLVCRPCLMRLADLAANPERHSTDEIAAAWEAHDDVVRLERVVGWEHAIVAWPLVKRCQHRVLGWVWTETWPAGDSTPSTH